jgi:polysaccharide transporter, PST family
MYGIPRLMWCNIAFNFSHPVAGMSGMDWIGCQTFFRRLQGRKHLQDIIANMGWLVADRILRMGVGLVVGVWVARYLGVEQFGLFSYAGAFVALFSTLATLGLPPLVVRTLTDYPEQREEILGTVFWLQLLGGFGTLVLSVSTMFVLRRSDPIMLSLVAIFASSTIFQAFETIDLWFQSRIQSKYTVLAKNTAFLTIAIVKVILINLKAPLLAFAGATLAEVVVGVVGLIVFYQYQGHSIGTWRWSLKLAQKLLRESWPLILSGFSIIIYMRVDQIMLGQMVGDQMVGIYSAATRVSEVWYFVPGAIASSVAPGIYAAKKAGDEALYYRRIGQSLQVLALISILIAVPMTFVSGPIITGLFGNEYAAAGPILAIHIWAALFVFTGIGTSTWFIAEGLTHLSFQRTLIGAVINICLNFGLIPAYGGVGAAIATVISQAFASCLSNAFHPAAKKIFRVQLRSFLPFLMLR